MLHKIKTRLYRTSDRDIPAGLLDIASVIHRKQAYISYSRHLEKRLQDREIDHKVIDKTLRLFTRIGLSSEKSSRGNPVVILETEEKLIQNRTRIVLVIDKFYAMTIQSIYHRGSKDNKFGSRC